MRNGDASAPYAISAIATTGTPNAPPRFAAATARDVNVALTGEAYHAPRARLSAPRRLGVVVVRVGRAAVAQRLGVELEAVRREPGRDVLAAGIGRQVDREAGRRRARLDLRRDLIVGDRGAAVQRFEQRPALRVRQGEAEDARDGRRDIDVAGRQRILETAAEVGAGGDQRVVDIARAEAAVHAAVAVAAQHAGHLRSRYAIDLGVDVVVVAQDDVGVLARGVERMDRAERQRAGQPAVAVIDEDRTDLGARLQEADRLRDQRRI